MQISIYICTMLHNNVFPISQIDSSTVMLNSCGKLNDKYEV